MAPSSSRSPNKTSLTCFAVTAPGIEQICARELEQLGVRPTLEEGGITWTGDAGSVAAANLWLRTASRVLVRVAEFRAKTFFELERSARKIDWERFVPQGGAARFRVTCRKSKLYHSGAVAQRFAEAVAHRVSSAAIADAQTEEDDAPVAAGQLFVVRFLHDVCTVSADSSGDLLHRRGYRQALAKAPLRETLAAAMLLGAGWTGETPLVDPMCGSGTIPIEAARLARRIAPGRDRRFAFLDWPETNLAAWKVRVEQARDGELVRAPVSIVGADRDAGAIDAATTNAERGGVRGDVDLRVQAISALTSDESRGFIISNPPYGTRVGERTRLRNLYAQLGNVVRQKRPEWTLALLLSDRQLEAQVGLPFRDVFETRNGGIPVRLVMATPQNRFR
ncbi:MAG TPA: class I SAM-dependent RNA methyltransferase [Gemmatimonadaceae bacterium]|nr:class I SAM-dependent RNA methyltransferase [Gemmatimonadaceae bacterium]